jgi:prepilin-type N-terminal cleavage/methylation domain-containing protein
MRRHRGFSLIEVLVTLVVISAGLLAYVAMQRGIFREASLSAGRVAASELALSKIEDLRSFEALYTAQATTGQFAYQSIAANAGGTLASGNVTVDNIAFTRVWAVTNYWYWAANDIPHDTAPTGNPSALPNFKLVTVTISWSDQNGDPRNVTLPSIIAAIDPRRLGSMFN